MVTAPKDDEPEEDILMADKIKIAKSACLMFCETVDNSKPLDLLVATTCLQFTCHNPFCFL